MLLLVVFNLAYVFVCACVLPYLNKVKREISVKVAFFSLIEPELRKSSFGRHTSLIFEKLLLLFANKQQSNMQKSGPRYAGKNTVLH